MSLLWRKVKWELKYGPTVATRIAAAWSRYWPFVMKSTLCKQRVQHADINARIRADYEQQLAALRTQFAPIIDKLLHVDFERPDFVVHDMRPAILTNRRSIDEDVPIHTARYSTRPKYRICVDIATDMIEMAFVHGDSALAIKECARRVAYQIEREMKTINFQRLRTSR